MTSFFRKNKIVLAIAVSVLLLIALAAVTASVHRGRTNASSVVNESMSVYEEENRPTVSAVFCRNKMENVQLPSAFLKEPAQSVKRADCKKYTELTVHTKLGTFTARDYHYAYLLEDEQLKIPKDALRFSENNIDFYITKNDNGTAEALYYQGLTKYTLTVHMTANDLTLLLKGME